MADYSKTIANTLSVFGPEPTEKWASATTDTSPMIWGTDNWAYGTSDLPIAFTKGIFNSVLSDSMIALRHYRFLTNAITLTDDLGKNLSKLVSTPVPSTSTVGKGLLKLVSTPVPSTSSVGKNLRHLIEVDVPVDTNPIRNMKWNIAYSNATTVDNTTGVYRMRDAYFSTIDGISNVVSWPKASVYTAACATVSSWTTGGLTTTVWV